MTIRFLNFDDTHELITFLNNFSTLWKDNNAGHMFRNAVFNNFMNLKINYCGNFIENKLVGLCSSYFWNNTDIFTLSPFLCNLPPDIKNFQNIIVPVNDFLLEHAIAEGKRKYYGAIPSKKFNAWKRMNFKYSIAQNKFVESIYSIIPAGYQSEHEWQKGILFNQAWPLDMAIRIGNLKEN